MAKVPEYKKKLVEDMVRLMRQYPIIGVVNMSNLPAPQLQSMRAELRGKVELFMTKRRLMKIAIEEIKNEKKNVEELEKYFEGMPAFIFTNESPFKLSKILQKSKTSAPAKAGQIAPNDIIVRKGPTPFAPGPVISELTMAGLKVGVENGKVAVKEDTVVAKKGEKIKPKVAEILTRLDIKPMQVGLGLVAAYEKGVIYLSDILEIDEKAFNERINLASRQAFNLAFNIAYPTKENISLLLAKAFNDAKALGISQEIFDEGIIEELLSKAERSMLSLKSVANIKVAGKAKEKPIKEPGKETKQEIKKESEAKKEERALEEEKEILKEEQKLEEKPKQDQTPEEKEVWDAVKEEEEKQLEQERIKKEEEVERAEKAKTEQIKKDQEDEADKKVKDMVEKTKKFAEGKEETAADILDEVEKKEESNGKLSSKEEQKSKVPSAHDLKNQKEDKKIQQDKAMKEVEDLTKELLTKGTLRKK